MNVIVRLYCIVNHGEIILHSTFLNLKYFQWCPHHEDNPGYPCLGLQWTNRCWTMRRDHWEAWRVPHWCGILRQCWPGSTAFIQRIQCFFAVFLSNILYFSTDLIQAIRPYLAWYVQRCTKSDLESLVWI